MITDILINNPIYQQHELPAEDFQWVFRKLLPKQHNESTVFRFIYRKPTNPPTSSVYHFSLTTSVLFCFLSSLSSSALGNQQLTSGQHLSEGRIKGQAHVGKCQEVPQAVPPSIQELRLFIPTKDSTSACLWPSPACDVLASRDEGEGWMSFWPFTTCLC